MCIVTSSFLYTSPILWITHRVPTQIRWALPVHIVLCYIHVHVQKLQCSWHAWDTSLIKRHTFTVEQRICILTYSIRSPWEHQAVDIGERCSEQWAIAMLIILNHTPSDSTLSTSTLTSTSLISSESSYGHSYLKSYHVRHRNLCIHLH